MEKKEQTIMISKKSIKQNLLHSVQTTSINIFWKAFIKKNFRIEKIRNLVETRPGDLFMPDAIG